nr:immunoglobulin light chain junction region [Macaca mulatta]
DYYCLIWHSHAWVF